LLPYQVYMRVLVSYDFLTTTRKHQKYNGIEELVAVNNPPTKILKCGCQQGSRVDELV